MRVAVVLFMWVAQVVGPTPPWIERSSCYPMPPDSCQIGTPPDGYKYKSFIPIANK